LGDGRKLPCVLAAAAIAVCIAGCDRPADKSVAAKPELTPTPPAIAGPSANPPPVMPPPASTALPPTAGQGTPSPAEKAAPEKGTPVDADGAKPDPAQTAQGSDPTAKQPMTKDEESNAMPKPAQANDHSTTATDSKQ
jgi:hypothetical protein